MSKTINMETKTNFAIHKLCSKGEKPFNKQEVLVYSIIDTNESTLVWEPATYLIAGTEVDCGIDMEQLPESANTGAKKLAAVLNGQGTVQQVVEKTGFYAAYYEDDDLVHYQYLNPDYILAWAQVPELEIEEPIAAMMPVDDLNDSIRIRDCVKKTQLAHDISKAFMNQRHSVEKVHLDIFFNKKHHYLQEYVVVEYDGGAIAVRNNNANSVSATYDAIGELLNGGYYDEVNDYRKICHSDEWIQIDVSQYII